MRRITAVAAHAQARPVHRQGRDFAGEAWSDDLASARHPPVPFGAFGRSGSPALRGGCWQARCAAAASHRWQLRRRRRRRQCARHDRRGPAAARAAHAARCRTRGASACSSPMLAGDDRLMRDPARPGLMFPPRVVADPAPEVARRRHCVVATAAAAPATPCAPRLAALLSLAAAPGALTPDALHSNAIADPDPSSARALLRHASRRGRTRRPR